MSHTPYSSHEARSSGSLLKIKAGHTSHCFRLLQPGPMVNLAFIYWQTVVQQFDPLTQIVLFDHENQIDRIVTV